MWPNDTVASERQLLGPGEAATVAGGCSAALIAEELLKLQIIENTFGTF